MECPICFEAVGDLRQLSCAHKFCQTCLNKLLFSGNTESNSLTCPICQSRTEVKDGDVMNLQNVTDPLKPFVVGASCEQQLCEMCDSNEISHAVHFCQACGVKMCDGCVEKHNDWSPNRKHNVVRLEDIGKGKTRRRKIYCPQHKVSVEEKYICTDVCITCKKFICLRCRIVFHEKKGHTVEDAGEYNASVKKCIQILQAQAEVRSAAIEVHLEFIDRQTDRVTNHIDAIRNEISDVYLESIRKLNERKSFLLELVDVKERSLCKRLMELKNDYQQTVDCLDSASSLLGSSLKAPLGSDSIAMRDSLLSQLQGLIDHDDPDEQLVTDVTERAEEMTFRRDKHDNFTIGHVFVRSEMIRGVKLSGRMSALAAHSDGRMAVGYGNGGLEFVSHGGQVLQNKLKDVKIRDLKFLSDGGYVVLDYSNGVTRYSPTDIKSDETFITLSYEEGGDGCLAVDKFDLIYVGYRKLRKIQEFHSKGGYAIREISCNDFEPLQITCYYPLLIITDQSSVRLVDTRSVVKHGRVKNSNVSPFATVTQDNDILVAWVKQEEGLVTVKKHNSNLKSVKTLISDWKIEESVTKWYYLQVFTSGKIAFCTPNRLYIRACPEEIK